MSNDFLKDNIEFIKSFIFNNEVKNYVLDPKSDVENENFWTSVSS